MPFPTSYVNGKYLEGLLGQTINPTWSTAGRFKFALHNDSFAGSKNTLEGWANTTEVSSTNYTTKGIALSNPTFLASGGNLTFKDSNATMQWTNVSFTTYGGVLMDTGSSSPNDQIVVAINFGGAKLVAAGNFTISWDSTYGLFYMTY